MLTGLFWWWAIFRPSRWRWSLDVARDFSSFSDWPPAPSRPGNSDPDRNHFREAERTLTRANTRPEHCPRREPSNWQIQPPNAGQTRRLRTALGNRKDVQNGDPRKAHSALDRFFVALFRRRSGTDFHPSKLTKIAKFGTFARHPPNPDPSTLTGAIPPQKSHSQCKNVRQTMPQKLAHTTLLLLRRVFFSRSEALLKEEAWPLAGAGCVRWQLPRARLPPAHTPTLN